ncbi:hypothetical protein ACJJTC_019395 [Scirpophaga incertulas]
MSLEIVNKKKRPCELVCLFCDSPGQLVSEPKSETFLTIRRAAKRRKDEVSVKFERLYDPECTVQSFSWHRNCMASYVSEEKIRRRELALYKEEQSAKSSVECSTEVSNRNVRKSLRTSENTTQTLTCLICGKKTKNKVKTLHTCSELSAAQNIFNTAHVKQDNVFTAISTSQVPQDLLAREVKQLLSLVVVYERVLCSKSGGFIKMDKIEFRAVIKHFWIAGKTATEIRNILQEVHGASTPSFSTISFWSGKKPGRPSSNIPEEILEAAFEKLRSKGRNTKQVMITSPLTNIPADCKDFFMSTENKLQLVKFLCKHAPTYAEVNDDKELYICGGFDDPTKCFKLQGATSAFSEVTDLKSNHLEADCRIFCHIFQAVKQNMQTEIIILSPDTDIFVLGIYFWHKIEKLGCRGLWFEGSRKKNRFLGCHLAAKSLGENVCNVLPALHALTGCDTTSRVGTKKQMLSAAKLDFVQEALLTLGDGLLTTQQFKALEKVCTYLISKHQTTADEVRHKLICQNIGFALNLSRVICTSDALYLHCLRASAQVYLWKYTHEPMFEPIDFLQFGYELREGNLYPKQMTKNALPMSLIKPCKCKSNCRTMSCSCRKENLNCIPLCKCVNNNCINLKQN